MYYLIALADGPHIVCYHKKVTCQKNNICSVTLRNQKKIGHILAKNRSWKTLNAISSNLNRHSPRVSLDSADQQSSQNVTWSFNISAMSDNNEESAENIFDMNLSQNKENNDLNEPFDLQNICKQSNKKSTFRESFDDTVSNLKPLKLINKETALKETSSFSVSLSTETILNHSNETRSQIKKSEELEVVNNQQKRSLQQTESEDGKTIKNCLLFSQLHKSKNDITEKNINEEKNLNINTTNYKKKTIKRKKKKVEDNHIHAKPKYTESKETIVQELRKVEEHEKKRTLFSKCLKEKLKNNVEVMDTENFKCTIKTDKKEVINEGEASGFQSLYQMPQQAHNNVRYVEIKESKCNIDISETEDSLNEQEKVKSVIYNEKTNYKNYSDISNNNSLTFNKKRENSSECNQSREMCNSFGICNSKQNFTDCTDSKISEKMTISENVEKETTSITDTFLINQHNLTSNCCQSLYFPHDEAVLKFDFELAQVNNEHSVIESEAILETLDETGDFFRQVMDINIDTERNIDYENNINIISRETVEAENNSMKIDTNKTTQNLRINSIETIRIPYLRVNI